MRDGACPQLFKGSQPDRIYSCHSSRWQARRLTDPGLCFVRRPPLQKQTHKIEVPRSVPGMVTDRLLVMTFLDGIPITRLKDHTKK
jgi:hypothetical protein